jgi:hypothetical protein
VAHFRSLNIGKNPLISYGLCPENIHIHPSDYELSSLDDSFQSVFREKYGAKVLGSFIGSPEFIAQKLNQKLQSLEEEAEKVIGCSNIQQRYIFTRYCFGQKINHILRTTDLHLTEDFALMIELRRRFFALYLASLIPILFPIGHGFSHVYPQRVVDLV